MKSKTMNKAILGFFVSLFAIVLALNAVTGSYGDGDFVGNLRVEINNQEFDWIGSTPTFDVSETIPINLYFDANRDASDVMVEVTLEGLGKTLRVESNEFHIKQGGEYHERLVLTLPSSVDLDNLDEELHLVVKITAKNEDNSFIETYPLKVQRYQDSLNILSVDAPSTATAGSSFPVDIVVENNGNDRLENIYVKVSIADLGVQKKMYVGDLDPLDEIEAGNGYDFDEKDTVYKTVYLTLPSSAVSGDYNLEVEAYNVDTSVTKQEKIIVKAVETRAFPLGSKTVAPGKETTLEFTLVNPGEDVMVYTITQETAPGLIVEVPESTVVVSGADSRTISVNVKATSSAEEGTHVVTLNVNSESGLVKQVPLTVNVEKDSKVTSGFTGRTDTVFILTVVLVIVFVVLLIILIVLLTKKPAESEEFGETSYY